MKRKIFFILAVLFPLILSGIFIFAGHPDENGRISLTGETTSTPDGYQELIDESKVVLAKNAHEAYTLIGGVKEIVDVPTVESVDSPISGECPEGEDCGQGLTLPINSVAAFKASVLGQCINVDGAYGSQCWDLGAAFWQNYTGRSLNTCGSGAAKGTIVDGCWQKNAGSEFTMIWDKTQIQAGDWIITKGGTWGHVGMALGTYNGGYVTLLGTNQGGAACPQGGAVATVINMSLKDFAGAFRPNIYKGSTPTPNPDPTPTPPPQPTSPTSYQVQRGDTLGGISLKNGWWPSVNGLYGDDGYAQRLAEKNNIFNRGLIFPNQIINRAE